MRASHSFELLDPFPHFPSRNPLFITRPRFSSCFHSPLARAAESEEDCLDFELDVLCPSSISVDLPRSHCLQYQPFLFSLLPSDFFDAATDLIFHIPPETEDIRSCMEAPEGKWKWTAEIKRKKGEGLGQKWKCKEETNGAFKKKSMGWTVEYQGKGKYTFHAASGSAQEDWERGKKEKKEKRVKARTVEIADGTDQQLVSKRQASVKRTVHTSKNKKKELSPQDAAMAIQKTFRDHMLRRSLALHSLRDLAVAKSKLKEIRSLFSNFSFRRRISKDAEERQRFSEKVIVLLLTVDAIEGQDLMVRSAKRLMSRELEAVLEVVDAQPHRESSVSRQPKFDLPFGSFSAEMMMSSGVADVVRMLDQEDHSSSSILPGLTL